MESQGDHLGLRELDGDCEISVKVVPRSSQNKIVGIVNGELKLKIQAPPVEGAANEAVLDLLAYCLKKPKSALKVLRGETSRHKVIQVRGMTAHQVLRTFRKQ
jgi:uncharacterized protein